MIHDKRKKTFYKIKMERQNSCTLMIWDVPRHTKNQFKRACASKGVSMKETIIEFLEKFAADAES